MSKTPYSYIAFEGPLASDKRELARQVSVALNGELINDLTQNPFLESFYKNNTGAAFQTQLFYLLNRYQILQEVKQPDLFYQLKVSDFIIEKDRIYAYQNLTDSELALYEKLYTMLIQEVVKPDLVVYLQQSTKRVMETLKKRRGSRFFDISPNYIENVVEGYNRFFFHYEETPLVVLNVNNVDFSRDRVALNELLGLLCSKLHGVTYFTPPTSTE